MSAERDLAEAIRDEMIARHALDAALTIWHDRLDWDERQRMWAVLAGISCCAIDTVLARRQSEAARAGPWGEPANDPDRPYPGSPEAAEAGCTCPIVDNAHGEGIPYHGETNWWIRAGCPLHGARAKRRGPWEGGHHFQEEDGYPGSLLPPKRGTP
jgi:hypothetical protein